MTGRLIAVVGPSGVGKDSVMAGIIAARPDITLVRRTITRPADLGGENYDATTPNGFARALTKGAFSIYWDAHGFSYGIGAHILRDIENGAIALANLSRGALQDAARSFPALTVLHVTAQPQTLAARLTMRGREDAGEIAKRLAQADKPLPAGLDVITLHNDGTLADTVAQAVAALQPVRG